MKLIYTKKFKKQFKKIPNAVQTTFEKRVAIFVEDVSHPTLKVHPLQGKYIGYWSMNVTGDIRALYRKDEETIIIFALIGTHSSLYG